MADETEFGQGPGIINSDKLRLFGDVANTEAEERMRVIATPPFDSTEAESAEVGLPEQYKDLL